MEKAALRYAQALTELTQSEGTSKPLLLDMRLIQQLCTEHASLWNFLTNPLVKADKKYELLGRVLTTQAHPLTESLLSLLAKRNRFNLLLDIARSLIHRLEKSLGIVRARVSTAHQFPQDLLEKLRASIRNVANCQSVDMTVEIVPSLLGGYVLQTETWRLDQSVSHKLDLIQKNSAHTA